VARIVTSGTLAAVHPSAAPAAVPRSSMQRAFAHRRVLAHAEAEDGTFGMVTALIVQEP
jgi:hypothetical protein